MQAVILAGGKGTRLAERLHGRPKPLVDVGGTPLLERQLDTLAAHGVDDVVILVSYAADQISAFIKTLPVKPRVRLIDDGEPRGTAGATLACLDQLASRFLVVYGDTMFDIDIAHMLAAHESAGANATLLLHPNDHPFDSDLVELGAHDAITAFRPYPRLPGADLRNLVNAAFYVVERDALVPWRDTPTPSDFAKDLFPAMLTAGARLHGYVSFEYIKDLGTPSRLDKVSRHVASGVVARASRGRLQAAVFLDRDGVLNQHVGYVTHPDQLRVLDGAAQAVRRLNDAEMRTVLTTNQPVIARGDCSLEQLAAIHARLERKLGEGGAYLDRVEFCPHHPVGGFPGEVGALKIPCECRKPGTGMLMRAMAALNVDRNRSWMVGDSTADMLAANRAGLTSVLVETGEGGRDGKHAGVADFAVSNVAAAANLIVETYPRMAEFARAAADDVGAGDVVVVSGLPRVGKTGFAAALRTTFRNRGLDAVCVSLDGWTRPEAAQEPGLEGRIDLAAIAEAFRPWLEGQSIEINVPVYNRFTRRTLSGDPICLSPDTVTIFEGVPAALIDWQGVRRVHKIHLTSAEPDRRARVESDMRARGMMPDAVRRAYHIGQAETATLSSLTEVQPMRVLSLDGAFLASAL